MQSSNHQRVYHPLLFALNFPGIVIVSNLNTLSIESMLLVLAITMIATSILWYALQLIIKDIYISAFFASLCVATFYLYGQIHILFFLGLELSYVTDKFLFGLFATIFLISILAAWQFVDFFPKLSKPLNLISSVLVFSLIVSAIPRLINTDSPEFDIKPANIAPDATGYNGLLPDVYLIVLDAYPRADVFENFSGQEAFFEEELEALGFRVATKSKTNYLYTQGLLPTLLNFNYLPTLIGDHLDPEASGTAYLDQLIQDNAVCRTFQSIGYKVVTNNSTWRPTQTSKCADQVLSDYNELFELANIYINTTVLRPFLIGSVLENLQESRRKAFHHLLTVSEMDEPTFMFAHVLLPHTPYVFDEDGDIPPDEGRLSFFMTGNQTANSESEYQAFAKQSIYTAKLTLDAIKQILETSDVPPIIIVQSDHGPDFRFQYEEEYYAQRAPILNAYYLPYGGESIIRESISPVNTFRAIFNYYFGADLKLLEDRIYVSQFTEDRYYDFRDITTKTLVHNQYAHIGIDWDKQFYEVSSLSNNRRDPVLRIYLETLFEENTVVMDTSNNWVAGFSIKDGNVEFSVEDVSGNSIIEMVTRLPARIDGE